MAFTNKDIEVLRAKHAAREAAKVQEAAVISSESPEAHYCPQCGVVLPDEAKPCINCGYAEGQQQEERRHSIENIPPFIVDNLLPMKPFAIALLAITFLLLLFPPFYYDVEGTMVAREWHIFFTSHRGDTLFGLPSKVGFLDALLSGSSHRGDISPGRPGKVDVAMLFLEFFLTGTLVAMFYFFLRPSASTTKNSALLVLEKEPKRDLSTTILFAIIWTFITIFVGLFVLASVYK
jgi:zinc-ribbon domain